MPLPALAVIAAVLVATTALAERVPLRAPADIATVVDAISRGRCAHELPTLEALAARTDPSGARAAYLRAHCLKETGRLRDALGAFDMAAGRHPTLRSYAQVQAAEAALALGDAHGALHRIGSLSAATPSVNRRSGLLRVEALVRAGGFVDAERVARDLLPQLADRRDVAKVWWWRARAADARGALVVAADGYVTVAWGFPESDFAAAAVRRLQQISRFRLPTAAARLERARWLMPRGHSGAAERELAIAVRGHLTAGDAADAWYRLGLLRLPSRRRLAASSFLAGARVPVQADRALYWAGRALIAAGRRTEGRAIWRRLDRSYPTSRWTARALYAMGVSAESAGAWANVDTLYAEVARRFPQSAQGQEAAWRRGWWRYRTGNLRDAETVFVNLARLHPDSIRASAALYWAARIRARRGTDAKDLLNDLIAAYPLSYYGRLAARQLGVPSPLPPAVPKTELPPDRFEAADQELGALGFHREAAEAASAAPTRDAARFRAYHLALAGEVSAPVLAADVALAGRRGQSDLPDRELWELGYPAAYAEAVGRAAAATGVDRYLILAVIREETHFDAAAISPAGAMGLMQLLPSTAGFLVRGRVVAPSALMRPEINILYGATYLQRMLRRFGGNVALALIAYNAGSGRAARLARTGLSSDEAEFIERIPIDETRAYVRRVLESYGIYRWLYR